MKYLLFLFLTVSAYSQVSNYALLDSHGVIIQLFVATPEIASTYPKAIQQVYPNVVNCVPALNAQIGWTYDAATNTFQAPVVAYTAPSVFTLEDPTPVTFTSNNAAVTTNNVAP